MTTQTIQTADIETAATTTKAAPKTKAAKPGPKKPAPKAKPAKAEKIAKEKPLSLRAQIEADAAAGKLPAKLAFTSAGDKRYQTKVDLLNDLAAKGDIKGLKAVEIKPTSSSPKKMLRWRGLVVVALEAKRKAARQK